MERALKKAILNRKNALFYKTLNGAGVGDLFMSLIHTCELNERQCVRLSHRVAAARRGVEANPSEWMPWNYRETLARLATPAPRNMMIPAWPKRIDCGHGWVTL